MGTDIDEICETCTHRDACRYFDLDNNISESELEKFVEYCVGCCCGDGCECNRVNGNGCCNWEDGIDSLLG